MKTLDKICDYLKRKIFIKGAKFFLQSLYKFIYIVYTYKSNRLTFATFCPTF
jgi:hypothetical protein